MKPWSGTAPRRVLIIVENLPVPFDRRVWQEATTLRDAGYRVSVICPTGKGFEQRTEDRDGIRIYRHPLPAEGDGVLGYLAEYGAAFLWQFWLSLKAARQGGFDVVHACNPPDTIFILALFYRLFGKRFVFDHHDANPELFEVKFGRRGVLYRVLCALERWTYRAAHVSIATNESYRDIAITRGGMDPDKVFVVRSGPDLSRLRRVAPDPAYRKGRRYVAGYVGIMGAQDGIDGLLETVRVVVHERGRTDIQFLLIGSGTELEAMRRKAARLGVADYVTFTGYLRGEALLRALSSIDVGLAPDPINDYNTICTMNKLMEYMALGIPMVQNELREGRFTAGEASLYARQVGEFADKVLQLLDDEALRRQMGEVGRHRMETMFDWSFEAPRLLAAYEEVFGPAKRRGAVVET